MRVPPGTRLGPFEIVEAIGAGGMGEVYRARDPRLRRDVAIKVLQSTSTGGAEWDRFQREAHAASALSHPNICAVYDVGEADGQPYLVMELLEGVTLHQFIDGRPLDVATTVALAIQIANALEAAHAKGIVHRDIKPGNVMIVGRRHVKVLDFGLAKHAPAGEAHNAKTIEPLTAAGSLIGTPAYLSPEILRGAQADARSDLWAFGVVLYQMLSGRPPFAGATAFEMSSAILGEQAPPLAAGVPSELRSIVERCLEKAPESRYQHAGEIRSALEAVLHGSTAAPATGRRAWFWAAAAVAAAVLVVGVFVRQRPGGTSEGKLSTGAPASANQEANELFELAMNFGRVQNDIPRAQEAFGRALALDPHLAEARRYHAFDYVLLLLNGYTNDVGLLYKAEEELRQVAREAPDLVSLPSAQTAVYLVQGRKELVPLERLELVRQQHPSSGDSSIWRFILHMFAEENAPARNLAESTLKRDPLLGAMRMLLGALLRTEGDVTGAIRAEQKVLEQAPGNISAIRLLALAFMNNGEPAKARQLLEEKRPLFSRNYMWRQTWALLLAAEGKRDEALQAMDEDTLKFAAAVLFATLETAEFYALLGDTPKAIEWLERAVRNGDERTTWFRRDPHLASIQNDPRFLRIVDSVEARRARK